MTSVVDRDSRRPGYHFLGGPLRLPCTIEGYNVLEDNTLGRLSWVHKPIVIGTTCLRS